MARTDIRGYVIPLSEKLAAQMGYELVDAELVKEGPGRYLRIYLDKEGGFSLEDCERFHRAIQPKLDSVDYDFLEVSSPGIDRPLKTPRDFDRALNTEVEIRLYKPQDGLKAYTGTLMAYDQDTARILTPANEEKVFALKAVAQIKPVIRWDDDEGEIYE